MSRPESYIGGAGLRWLAKRHASTLDVRREGNHQISMFRRRNKRPTNAGAELGSHPQKPGSRRAAMADVTATFKAGQ